VQKLNEELLALRKAKLGPDHPDTLMSMHNLAYGCAALGRHADALKLQEASRCHGFGIRADVDLIVHFNRPIPRTDSR
jgi:hypothetical protein